jgi:hypothetical protein
LVPDPRKIAAHGGWSGPDRLGEETRTENIDGPFQEEQAVGGEDA